MGGGGSVEVKETETQKAQAEVAESMWELYQQELAPYEDVFIQDVNKMNNPLAYQKAAGDIRTAEQQRDLNILTGSGAKASGAMKYHTEGAY